MSLAGNGRRTPPEHAPGASGVPNLTVVADREPAAFAAGPAVRLTDVTKVYGQGTRAVLALDKVSLSVAPGEFTCIIGASGCGKSTLLDRKSTRLNSSHTVISYAVFCLKKKNMSKVGFT